MTRTKSVSPSPERIVARLSEELLRQIRSGALGTGTRLPSVRQLARERRISPFSASGVYNALVATGAVEAQAGQGYFVAQTRQAPAQKVAYPEFPADSVWERRREAQGHPIKVEAGCGWLPGGWLNETGVRTALRSLARGSTLRMEGYGSPFGLAELRAHLCTLLESRRVTVREDQLVLTQGASQALDLVVRLCLQPGDTVVVEDPGYPPLFEMLKDRGVNTLGIPRNEQGPDVDALEKLLKRRRIPCLFTNTTCHNPTGTTTDLPTAHRLLELANRYDVTVVEDDSFADLATRPVATLAGLDGLRRVIYVSSFSKTVSPSLRAGYLAASPALAQQCARAKVMTSLGSSELLEQLLLQILTDGHYRRHLKRLKERLAAAQHRVAREFEARGVQLAFRPQDGLFVWVKLPSRESVSKLWTTAIRAGVLLAPGELFRPDGNATPYWRFNVAQCDAPEVFRFLEKL